MFSSRQYKCIIRRTEVNDLNTARNNNGIAGVGTPSALTFGGNTPPVTAVTELWNGTNWTEVNDLNTARYSNAGAGIATAALNSGGLVPPATAVTEQWNGTNWSNQNNLNTAIAHNTSAGTTTFAFSAGGDTTAQTEEWFGDGTLSENID